MANTKRLAFSTLTRQYLLLRDRFAERYPNAWLVWEAGAWSPAADAGVTKTKTQAEAPRGPARDDALCFELLIAPKQRLRVGRAVDNDIVLDDATVSRHQLAIERIAPDQWAAVAERDGSPTLLQGEALVGEGSAISAGHVLRLGHVSLTFHSRDTFLHLVAAAAGQLS